MNTRQLVKWITFLAVFAMAMRVSVDTDTWWHLRAGGWMWEQKQILQVDQFSYTREGVDWHYPGWLVEIPMYLIFRSLGPGGLNIWTATMVTLTFLCLWPAMQGGVFLRAFVTILAATVSGVYWAARPYLVTFLLAACFLRILEDFRWRRVDHLFWLPLLMVLWANSHGGFAAGFLIWGVYFFWFAFSWIRHLAGRKGVLAGSHEASSFDVGADLRRMAIVGALLFVAVSLNPSGPEMLLYPFKTVGIEALQDYIQEWQSPDFHELQVQPFAWMLLLILGVVGAARIRMALTDFLLVSGFALMGFMAGRNIALFALAAPLMLTRHAAHLVNEMEQQVAVLKTPPKRPPARNRAALNIFLLILLASAVTLKAALVYPEEANEKAFARYLPVNAVHFLQEEGLPGKLFNSYNWGGYLLWALPEYPVFIDGRTDLYQGDVIDQWLQVVRLEPGWEEVLSRYQVRLVLIEKGSTLDRELRDHQGWELRYQDELAVIYAYR